MDKLKEMISKGPDPSSRGIGVLVLARYHDIAQARRQAWRWVEIAEGLGLPSSAGAALGKTFNRVKRRIETKTLEPLPQETPREENVKQPLVPTSYPVSEIAGKKPGFKRVVLDP